MKRILLLTLCTVLAALAGVDAQLLWKVEGKGLQKPSYLLGTHHFIPASFIDSIAGAKEAIDNCDVVYGEIDLSDIDPVQTRKIMTEFVVAPPDSTLTDVMTSQQLDSLNVFLKNISSDDYKLEPGNLIMFKPTFVNQAIIQLISMSMPVGEGEIMDGNIDIYVQEYAQIRNKEIKGLETFRQQCQLLYGQPIHKQVDDLMQTLRDPHSLVDDDIELKEAYKHGDIEKLEEMFRDPEKLSAADRKILLDNRNADWIETIEQTMPRQSMFIAVGLGHLLTDTGLIKMLRRRGYTVEAMK
ncbi:MAG: TraB/GumN family protein [Bacteroidales bacterium]|nr:TraB/GumN family protein [Bacteroidales bacterium]